MIGKEEITRKQVLFNKDGFKKTDLLTSPKFYDPPNFIVVKKGLTSFDFSTVEENSSLYSEKVKRYHLEKIETNIRYIYKEE